MEFAELPRAARLLVVGVCLLGAATLAVGLCAPLPRHVLPAVVYLALAFFSASKRVQIHPNVATMSLGFLFVFAALFQCGTGVAIAAAIVNALGGLLFRPADGWRQSPTWTFYSAGSLALAAWAAGMAYFALVPAGLVSGRSLFLLPAAAAVTLYYLVTVFTVGLVPPVLGEQLPSAKWWNELLWLAPIYYGGGAMALIVDAAYLRLGPAVFLLLLAPAYVIQLANRTRADQMRGEVKHLEERTQASEKMAHLYLSIVQALSTAIDVKDRGTHLHVRRVRALAETVARRVGLAGAELEAVVTGAVLHDIGKLAVPDHVLRKADRLSDDEFRLVKTHPAVGEAILKPIDFGADVAAIVRHHHEKMDGSGYPDGLIGEAILPGARVLGVIDVYDALVSDRPYRKAWSSERAVEYLREHAPAQFDASVVEALATVLGSGEVAEAAESGRDPDLERIAAETAGVLSADPEPAASAAPTADERRRAVLSELAHRFAAEAPLRACVAYEVDDRNGEIDAAVAVGDCADAFARVRLPVGVGPSGRAAAGGMLVSGPAAEEFACLSMALPRALTWSQVTAVPLAAAPGRVIGVLSLYAKPGAVLAPALLEELSAAATEAARRLEATEGSPLDGGRQREALLEYAQFLVALGREVEHAQESGERVLVAIIGARERLAGDFLWTAARELRAAGGGAAHILEREEHGEVLACFPAEAEAGAEECLQRIREMARTHLDANGQPSEVPVAIGMATFPADVVDAHGLISMAATRLTAGTAEEQMHDRLPALSFPA